MHVQRNEYYGICLDFKFHNIFLLWISDEIDLVAVDGNKILGFKSEAGLIAYCECCNLILTSTECFKLYKVQQFILNPFNGFDFNEVLNFWNLCTDISCSIGIKFLGDKKGPTRTAIYEKLYDGNGIFITYDPNPAFNNIELHLLGEILQQGMNLLLNNVVVKD